MEWSAELMQAYSNWMQAHGNRADPQDLREALEAVADRQRAQAAMAMGTAIDTEGLPVGTGQPWADWLERYLAARDDGRRREALAAHEQDAANFIETIVGDYRQHREMLDATSGDAPAERGPGDAR